MTSRKIVYGPQTGYTSYKAISNWALLFIADQLDLDALDLLIDAYNDQPGQAESISDVLATAIGTVHSRYRISLTKKSRTLEGGSENVQLWDP